MELQGLIEFDRDIEIEALKYQARRYENSALEYKEHERRNHWYGGQKFYRDEEIWEDKDVYYVRGNVDSERVIVRKYDATEDLAFLYTELSKIYQRLFELEEEGK